MWRASAWRQGKRLTLQRCEKAWWALLQSLQTKILNFMHTSLKPIRSSWSQVAHFLLSGSRRILLRTVMWSPMVSAAVWSREKVRERRPAADDEVADSRGCRPRSHHLPRTQVQSEVL